jgi:hypothetical protein
MKLRLVLPGSLKSEKGQVLAPAAITMAGMLGIAALGVDLGYLYVARNELQNVADGAALAGARILGHTYQGLTPTQQQGYVCDAACEVIIDSTANYVAHQNQAAGLEMDLLFAEVVIGHWDGDNFTATNTKPDAVKVIARRDEVHNGPVTTFFSRILGVDASSVSAYAITPSDWYAENGVKPKGIVPITDPPYWDLDPLIELDKHGLPVTGKHGKEVQLTYPNGDLRFRHAWETTVPVYDRDDCSNPNQSILIVGFAEVVMTDVYNSPEKLVKGIVTCDLVDDFGSRGGGGDYGIRGSVPGLVR